MQAAIGAFISTTRCDRFAIVKQASDWLDFAQHCNDIGGAWRATRRERTCTCLRVSTSPKFWSRHDTALEARVLPALADAGQLQARSR